MVMALGAAGLWYLGFFAGTPAPVAEDSASQTPTLQTYASSTLGYSLSYPAGYQPNEAYQYKGFPNKPIAGVSFSVPISIATGTNLMSDSRISVEQLPRAVNCTADIYVTGSVVARQVTEGGTTYSVATTSEGAAGHAYTEYVYAYPNSKPCTAVRYFLHSGNIGGLADGSSVREYDRAALLLQFNAIRDSLTFATAPTP